MDGRKDGFPAEVDITSNLTITQRDLAGSQDEDSIQVQSIGFTPPSTRLSGDACDIVEADLTIWQSRASQWLS